MRIRCYVRMFSSKNEEYQLKRGERCHHIATSMFLRKRFVVVSISQRAVHNTTVGLYESILGKDAYGSLPEFLRWVHGRSRSQVLQGHVVVQRSAFGKLFGLPKSCKGSFEVYIDRDPIQERWTHQIGNYQIASIQCCSPTSRLVESFGAVSFAFRLEPCQNGFSHFLESAKIGNFSIPHLFLPDIHGKTWVEGDAFYRVSTSKFWGIHLLSWDFHVQSFWKQKWETLTRMEREFQEYRPSGEYCAA